MAKGSLVHEKVTSGDGYHEPVTEWCARCKTPWPCAAAMVAPPEHLVRRR